MKYGVEPYLEEGTNDRNARHSHKFNEKLYFEQKCLQYLFFSYFSFSFHFKKQEQVRLLSIEYKVSTAADVVI